jgi:predicted metal-dependent enzyme (double-stranded beta helix superfamily)
MKAGVLAELKPGDVEVLLPAEGDIHQVTNALTDRGSISIHVYGGNIGAVRRHTFDVRTGEPKLFVSGYTNKEQPNLWDRSAEVRAAS